MFNPLEEEFEQKTPSEEVCKLITQAVLEDNSCRSVIYTTIISDISNIRLYELIGEPVEVILEDSTVQCFLVENIEMVSSLGENTVYLVDFKEAGLVDI